MIFLGGVFLTTIDLSQKERMLLEDQRSQEELCIQKYSSYAKQAQDPELKQLLQQYGQQEMEHLNTINQILSGSVPQMNQQQGQQQNQQESQQQNQQMNSQSSSYGGIQNANDKMLCNDLLSTEKYVSGAYDTTIFECRDKTLRDTLNHIQKEEQQHGEGIFNYMQSKGMYNVK